VYFFVFPAVSFGEPTSHSPLTPGFEGFFPGFFPFEGFFFRPSETANKSSTQTSTSDHRILMRLGEEEV